MRPSARGCKDGARSGPSRPDHPAEVAGSLRSGGGLGKMAYGKATLRLEICKIKRPFEKD